MTAPDPPRIRTERPPHTVAQAGTVGATATITPSTMPPAPQRTPPLTRDLARKAELEAAMLLAPHDRALRRGYFDHLMRIAGTHVGLCHAMLPDVGHPLYFRCASADVATMFQIFLDDVYAIPMRATPSRILDLGAFAGYAAVYFARRFPQAQIVCVEPAPASFRLLTMNIMPWRRIRAVNAAVWHTNTRLRATARYFGDWGLQLDQSPPDEQRTIPALSVTELLQRAGWSHADMVKCDIEGSEREVFADPAQPWLRAVDVAAVDTHDAMRPGSQEAVSACFPAGSFDVSRRGEKNIFLRRSPLRAISRIVPELPLIHAEPDLEPLAVQDVAPSGGWGFFVYEGNACQLHPNPPGRPPARLIVPRVLDGQTRFETTLHHAGHPAAPIVFSYALEREDGTVAARAAQTLNPLDNLRWVTPLPSLTGPHRIILQTEMAPGASNNFNAWARWIEPRLT
jgi:FkbM family methyltransferase